MLFMSKTLSKKSKLKLYNSVIRPLLTYASETWVHKKQIGEELLFLKGKLSEGSMGLLSTQMVWEEGEQMKKYTFFWNKEIL
jgi:hypothetical protein